MEKKNIVKLHAEFDFIVNIWPDSDVEFWFARDLQEVLGYAQWRNFQEVILKVENVCKNAGVAIEDHFADVSKKVEIGSGAERSIEDVMLTRKRSELPDNSKGPQPVAQMQSDSTPAEDEDCE